MYKPIVIELIVIFTLVGIISLMGHRSLVGEDERNLHESKQKQS